MRFTASAFGAGPAARVVIRDRAGTGSYGLPAPACYFAPFTSLA